MPLARPILNLTRNLPLQNQYTLALDNEFKEVAFNEERAPLNKGKWRSQVFHSDETTPLDLEIGTGTGFFFDQQAVKNPNRLLLGMELKYKPLIQTISRARRSGCVNVAICRFNGFNIEELFVENELDNVFIHFPDP